MTKIEFKGVHKVTRKLASGKVKVHYYAWRGGPALKGEPGSVEFIESYQAAVGSTKPKADGTFRALIERYRRSSYFTELAPKTRKDYDAILLLIERKFGTLPLAALAAPKIRATFEDWRDGFLPQKRKADYAWSVLARVLSVAVKRGEITRNPCERGDRLYSSDRAELTWSEGDLARLFAVASAEVAAVVTVALWTGQRQGDVLRLAWSAYDGQTIRVRQSKTAARVSVPVGAPLRDLLARLPRTGPLILQSSDGRPWSADGFRSSFRRACERAGIEDLHFHDLRGTAVTRMALAGCTVPQIAAVTGHSLDDVGAILDAHYLGERAGLAEQAIVKLDAYARAKEGDNG
jgi:integrase